jgi:hypothetical protein
MVSYRQSAPHGQGRLPGGDSLCGQPTRTFSWFVNKKGITMTVTLSTGPVIALIAGILILIMPRLLNYIIALYLIIIGVLGLLGSH